MSTLANSIEHCARGPTYIVRQEKDVGFRGGSVVKNSPANAEDMGVTPDLGGSHTLWSN